MSGEDRQSELARQHKERQAQRAAEERKQAARARRNIVLAAVLGVAVVVGGVVAATTLTGDDGEATAAASASPSESDTPSAPPSAPPKPGQITCEYRDDPNDVPKKDVGKPPKKPDLRWKTMTITTNHGDIVIELATQAAPCTVNSFAYLAKKDFYDGIKCHRLAVPENSGLALLQCGDPFAKADGKNPTDGQGTVSYVFDDENLGGMSYGRGTVFMAQPAEAVNQNGSQFAISFGDDTAQLNVDPAYTPFGTVIKGMDILDKIAKGGWITNPDDIIGDGGSNAPKIPVIIKDLTLSKGEDATGKGKKSAKKDKDEE
ncbi:peptidylprolyl isomerase [Thermostaphylospora chromogena]|uniref:Peptidyl-prolyl cis-trans isomerase B (Cyclophilin B) n=1 Tax=Thermostaphylospora chromogena TaxID=35622 RepID=A0A1H1HN44_9ACTN|nr:peptidylprolyl isomerase [Thermostaphylospora chromogena]SDR26844.1 peptidyl-prolyl cis-trans isomerase B (cyclophilin B) [Thermostaphylospora chromogena]